MGRFSPPATSGKVRWIDKTAGRFVIPHLCLGTFCILRPLLNDFELDRLLQNDFEAFMVLMSLTLWVTVTVIGILVMYFVAQADGGDSVRYARNSYLATIAYLCFCAGAVGVSWTFLIGYAFVSIAYLVESILLLAIARRTFRELRAAEDWASIR